MKPYYQDDFVTIYHGDCLEVLADLAPPCADVVIADPPPAAARMLAIRRAAEAELADCGNLDNEHKPMWPDKCGHLPCCGPHRKATCEAVRSKGG